MKTSFRMAALAALVATSLVSVSANAAAPVSNLFAEGQNRFSDSSAEFAFSLLPLGPGGSLVPVAVTGALSVGDYFFSVVNFDAAWSPGPGSPSSNGLNELTALSLIRIAAIGPALPSFLCGPVVLPGGCEGFTMAAPSAAVWGGILGAFGVAPANPGALSITDDTVAIFMEGPPNNFTRESTIATGVTTAGDGTLRLVADLVAANGDSWSAAAPADVSDIGGAGVSTVGSFSFDATISGQYFPGYVFAPQITGDGTISKPPTSSLTAFPIFDQSSVLVDIHKIPEPTTLALIGLGLLGVGAMQRRKQAVKNA